MSLYYLVNSGCSKFLPNTGFVTIILLRFAVKVKTAYCCNNFLAQRPLPDMRKLSGDDFLCFNRMAPRRISTQHRRIPGARVSGSGSQVSEILGDLRYGLPTSLGQCIYNMSRRLANELLVT